MTEERSTTAAHNAANAERRAAQTMDLGGHKVTLCIAVVVYILYLILPYAGPAHGRPTPFLVRKRRRSAVVVTKLNARSSPRIV